MSEEKLPIDRLIKIYIKMRDARKAIEAQSNAIEEQMEVVKGQILDVCKETNVSGLKTPYGRIVRSIKTFYTTADWPSMHQFIKEHDALDLVERRIHQSNMKTFLEENANLLPPGLNADRKYTVVVYRK
jgi:hypothetical protein